MKYYIRKITCFADYLVDETKKILPEEKNQE